MHQAAKKESIKRYEIVTAEKSTGSTYTPKILACFVAERIVANAHLSKEKLSILDPAIGEGELVLALLTEIQRRGVFELEVHGFDTDTAALAEAERRIRAAHPSVVLTLVNRNFLEFVLEQDTNRRTPSLFFNAASAVRFDLIIANPPYVRTQIMGADQAQQLGKAFGLVGRVDLYHAFLLGMAQVLQDDGTTGMIVSNRFMTTKGGSSLRFHLRNQLSLRQVWDLGDTKLFDAAVLPAIIIANGIGSRNDDAIDFCSIYETADVPNISEIDPIAALKNEGVVELSDGRKFHVRHGKLDSSGDDFDVWRIATDVGDAWLVTVQMNTWKTFGDLGKIRVGVKTCADKVYIRTDWADAFGSKKPELLRSLTTHHGAGRFRSITPKKKSEIIYPHEVAGGHRRAINLDKFPNSKAYLEQHRATLENRTYVIEAGRSWYEIWVPQDPEAWNNPKLVFRDISERPTFWIDLEGTVVNGDCYWLVMNRVDRSDLLWLAAAVANSRFIEAFYDHCFNNKLYAGRRRFITQYVEQFPLPNPNTLIATKIIALSKAIYDANHSESVNEMEISIDKLVWEAFGLEGKKVRG